MTLSVNLTNPSKTGLITFLLDRSYSMQTIKSATLEGFNGYVAGLQQESDADLLFTLLTFDDVSIDTIHLGVPISEAKMLTEESYIPRGGTPLVEAATKTILAVEQVLRQRTDKPRVVICIQTDGEENRSAPDYTTARLKDLIKTKTAEGWEFNFLGSGIDAYAQAQHYGFAASNTMSYNASDIGATRSAFAATATRGASFAAGRTNNAAYSMEDRKSAGDGFYSSSAPTTESKSEWDALSTIQTGRTSKT